MATIDCTFESSSTAPGTIVLYWSSKEYQVGHCHGLRLYTYTFTYVYYTVNRKHFISNLSKHSAKLEIPTCHNRISPPTPKHGWQFDKARLALTELFILHTPEYQVQCTVLHNLKMFLDKWCGRNLKLQIVSRCI